MKTKWCLKVLLVAGTLLSLWSSAAMASSGALKMQGRISNVACTFGTNTITDMNFPTIPVDELKNAGETAGMSFANVVVTCSGTLPAGNMKLRLSSTGADKSNNGTIKNVNEEQQGQGTATKVNFQLFDGVTLLPFDFSTGVVLSTPQPIAATVTFPLMGKYYATGVVTPGTVLAEVGLDMVVP